MQGAASGGMVRRTATVRAREWCRCLELVVKDLFDVYGTDLVGLEAMIRYSSCCELMAIRRQRRVMRHTRARVKA